MITKHDKVRIKPELYSRVAKLADDGRNHELSITGLTNVAVDRSISALELAVPIVIEHGITLTEALTRISGTMQSKSTIAADKPPAIESLESGPRFTEEEQGWVSSLIAILRSGNIDAVSAVTQNIKFFRWSVENARSDISVVPPSEQAPADNGNNDARIIDIKHPRSPKGPGKGKARNRRKSAS